MEHHTEKTLMTSGIKLLTFITRDLSAWCKKEGVTVHEMVGAAITKAST
jgi:hypothetical protein